jgi:cytochrome c553
MSLKNKIMISLAVVLTLPVMAGAEGDPERGKQKAETCLGCHAIENYTNVYPTYPVPKLGGQNAQYIVDALKAYASGDRPHVTMHAQAATLSDEDRQEIAAFLSSANGGAAK